MAVLNNSISYMPPTGLRLFENNLAAITMWLAQSTDIVLTPNEPDTEFLKIIASIGAPMPRFLSLLQLNRSNDALTELRPWGWSREIHHRLRLLKHRCSEHYQASPNAEWQTSYQAFFSRSTGVQLSNEIINISRPLSHIRIPHLPLQANSVDELKKQVNYFNGKVVLKAPWSSSGRGIQKIDTTKNRQPDYFWAQGIIKQQGFILVEPLLNKLHDLSFHYHIFPEGEVKYLGHNFFITDDAGRFKGSYIDAFPVQIINTNELDDLTKAIIVTSETLKTALAKMALHNHYTGPVGIDALWYEAENGQRQMHPSIEINLRHTMGLINIQLRQYIHPSSTASWQISHSQSPLWSETYSNIKNQRDWQMHEGKITSGCLPLTPGNAKFGAWASILPKRF
jgi:hypothetical protein